MLSSEETEKIIAENYQYIYRFFATSLDDIDEACDLTQEVFTVFIEKQDTLTDDNIKAWLYSVARNILIKEKRRLNINLKTVYIGDLFIEPTDPLSEDFISRIESKNWSDEKIDELKNTILSNLTDEELDIFSKIFVEKTKYSEIAKIVGVSESAISTRACRIKKKILKYVDLILTVAIIFIIKIRR